ncbi:MAG: HAMP domain-containing histidine kinase [Planctomycetia bacterium]|nr:HAMP domain-containing histidine kinase [Planctomycetia bacterium]
MRLGLRYRLLIPPVLLLAGTVAATIWAAAHAAANVDRQIEERFRDLERTVHGPPTFRMNEPILRQMRGLTGMELVYSGTNGERIATLADGYSEADFRRHGFEIRPPHPNEGGRLIALLPEAFRRSAIAEAVRPALWLGGLGGFVAFALAAITARRLVARIRDIEARTRDIAAGSFEPIPLPDSDDEVRDLVHSVNRMTATLSDYRDKLRATERLRVLGQFSGGLAHQLRNAASGARLAIQLYLRDADGDREPLFVALRQLERMESNLRQFLNLGRPDAIRREPLDLVAVLDAAVAGLRPQAAHSGITLEWKSGDPLPIRGDAEQLGHLIANLLGNALDAAGPGGRVELTAVRSGNTIFLEVCDNGPGPSPEVAQRLFEPFVTGKEQGVGLGLAIVRQVVDSHGGTIRWERRSGRTVFTVELPCEFDPAQVLRSS